MELQRVLARPSRGTTMKMMHGSATISMFFATSIAALAAPGMGDGFVMNLDTMRVPVAMSIARAKEAARLGARHFNIPVLLCQSDRRSNAMHWCDDDPENYRTIVRGIVQELTQQGFSIGLFPFLLSDDGAWRGTFEPTQFSRWSSQYLERLLELADWTKDLPIADFIVGSELTRLYRKSDSFWRNALTSVRARTHARTLIVANWDAIDAIRFWDASDAIGTSSYFPLADSIHGDTTVPALVRRWSPWKDKLLALSRKVGKPLYFAELGYSSRDGAASQPWAYEEPAVLNLDLQSRLFLAFEQAWVDEPVLSRLTIWAMSDLPAPLLDSGFAVQGKPAAAIVARIFQHRNSRAKSEVQSIPVVLTMDDLPMWFVNDSAERVKAFDFYRTTFVAHAVPAIGFVNPGFLNDSADDHRERDALRAWMSAGLTLGNHTAHHYTALEAGKSAFLNDVDLGSTLLQEFFPKWDARVRAFRFPNLQESFLPEILERHYHVVPVSFDSRDWSWSEEYHDASPSKKIEIRNRAFATLAAQFASAVHRRSFAESANDTPLILMIHSTRFTREQLEEILSFLESRGVRWSGLP